MPSSPPSLNARLRAAPITATLVAANLLVFALTALSVGALWQFPGAVLVHWGSNYGPLSLDGQPWRLLTALFVHGGFVHVALNMLGLWQLGAVVEPLMGRWRFLALYLGAGLLAGVASLGWRPQVNSVGASGAIFGVFATLLVDLRLRRDLLPRAVFRRVRSGLLGFLAFSLFAGLVLPGIDNAAHVGGLAGGLLLGYALAPRRAGGRWPDAPTRLGASLAALALAVAIWPGSVPVAPLARPQASAGGDPQQFIDAFEGEERDLTLGYELVLDGLRHRRLPAAEAARIIEDELLPGWDRQIGRLAVAQGVGGSDWRPPALIHYARLRQEALRAMLLAVRTRNADWLAASVERQREAETALLTYRMTLAREQGRERNP